MDIHKINDIETSIKRIDTASAWAVERIHALQRAVEAAEKYKVITYVTFGWVSGSLVTAGIMKAMMIGGGAQ